jgi:hypothetical protein
MVPGTAIWIVDTERYLKQAHVSAASVERQMPRLGRIIRTPETRAHSEWFIESTRLLCELLDEIPADSHVLRLDCDTYMVEPVPELFEMLDRFDMVAAHAPGIATTPTVKHVPRAFPEINMGMIAMRNNQRVRQLWEAVYARQRAHVTTYGNNDQAPLREELWTNPSQISLGLTTWEYNCRFGIGTFLRDPVKILHGYADDAAGYETIAAGLNQHFGKLRQTAEHLLAVLAGSTNA